MPEVVSIHRVERRDAEAIGLTEAQVVEGFGLAGDWRSRRGKRRQITLIEAEALEEVARTLGVDSVPAGASRRQVVVRGIGLNDIVGKRLRIGPLLIEVYELCDPCENMEVKIGPGARAAMEGKGGVCALVLTGGVLRPGDPIAMELSDT